MRKAYKKPTTETLLLAPTAVLALSILDGNADSGTGVLVKDNDWELSAPQSDDDVDFDW